MVVNFLLITIPGHFNLHIIKKLIAYAIRKYMFITIKDKRMNT